MIFKENLDIHNIEEVVLSKKNEDELLLFDRLDLNQGNFVKPSHAIDIDTTNITIEEVYK